MPRAKRRCSNKCPNPVTRNGKCHQHQPPRVAWKKSPESFSRDFLKSKEWQLQRKRVLHRDNKENGGCQLRLVGCTETATRVDHKAPVWYTQQEQVPDDDLQGLCESCHQYKSSYEGVQAKRIKRLLGNS